MCRFSPFAHLPLQVGSGAHRSGPRLPRTVQIISAPSLKNDEGEQKKTFLCSDGFTIHATSQRSKSSQSQPNNESSEGQSTAHILWRKWITKALNQQWSYSTEIILGGFRSLKFKCSNHTRKGAKGAASSLWSDPDVVCWPLVSFGIKAKHLHQTLLKWVISVDWHGFQFTPFIHWTWPLVWREPSGHFESLWEMSSRFWDLGLTEVTRTSKYKKRSTSCK